MGVPGIAPGTPALSEPYSTAELYAQELVPAFGSLLADRHRVFQVFDFSPGPDIAGIREEVIPHDEIYGENGVYYSDRQLGELNGNVRGRMLDNSLVAKSKRAIVNKTTSQIWLNDEAIAWHDRQQISGDSILLHIKEIPSRLKRKSIDEIQIHGNAFFAAQDTLSLSPVVYDQFSAKKMIILLNDNSKITGITLTTQAESLYHLYNSEQKPTGINYSSGDMMRMFFTAGILKRVKVTGNVEGKQYPESFRGDKKINLSAFAWRENENPFKQPKSLP